MNEISNQSLQSVVLQASGVATKLNAKPAAGNGKVLPPAATEATDVAAINAKGTGVGNSSGVGEKLAATRENVQAAIAEMSEYAQSIQRDIQFSIDNGSGRTVVSVVDRQSQEVVRQIPGEVFLKLARHLKESLAAGEKQSLHFISAKA